jgi:Sporulation and spore germination
MADRRKTATQLAVLALTVTGCVGVETTGVSNTTEGMPATTAASAPSSTTPPPSSTDAAQTTVTSTGEVSCERPEAEPGSEAVVVTVYETCDIAAGAGNRVLAGLLPLQRATAAGEDPISTAMEALLAGPTAEESAAGFTSWFSSGTADALLDASVDADGLAMIDLDGDSILGMNNVSTTRGGDFFRGQLYGTAFALEEVSEVGFSIDGSTSAFCAMMELIPECTPITRAQWDEIYSQTSG